MPVPENGSANGSDRSDRSDTPDKLLFTPGPLTTSATVKRAMLTDLGSRDASFLRVVKEIREELVALAGGKTPEWVAVPMQGSGTFSIESVISSVVPADGKLLVLSNGAYGQRMATIARVHHIPLRVVTVPEHQPITAALARAELASDDTVSHVAVVHSETTTGIVNPVEAIGEEVGDAGCDYIVDAMSSFGGIPLDVPAANIDYLVSSANKCIEGVPGFGFVIARRIALEGSAARAKGCPRSLSLDLLAQMRGLDGSGQFRFTPPTHALLAFHQALAELRAEGGIAGRAHRYRENARALATGMARLGFQPFLDEENRGYIITSYRYPTHPAWKFEDFYARLSERGFVIYPGKVSDADCFRIGTIGRLYPRDVEALIAAIAAVLAETGVSLTGSPSP